MAMPAIQSAATTVKQLAQPSTASCFALRRRLAKKYEQATPNFLTYFEEIEYWLRYYNVELRTNSSTNSKHSEAQLRHWIKVAILAGYSMNKSYIKSRAYDELIHFVGNAEDLWGQVLNQLLVEWAISCHPELQPAPTMQTYVCYDSYGYRRLRHAENLCSLVKDIYDIRLTKEEEERCLMMVANMKCYKNTRLGLTIRKNNNTYAISRKLGHAFFEVVALEIARDEQQAC